MQFIPKMSAKCPVIERLGLRAEWKGKSKSERTRRNSRRMAGVRST